MTNKFTPTIADKLNTMNKEMVAAREQKKKELMDKYIPEKLKTGLLTPEEVNRSATIGIVIGLCVLLAIIIGLLWWFFL